MSNSSDKIRIASIIILIWGILSAVAGVAFAVFGGMGTAFTASQGDKINSIISGNAEIVNSINELNNTLGMNITASDAVGVIAVVLIIIGLIAIIGAVIDILCAIFGFKAAKGKSAKPAFVIGIINIVLAVIAFVFSWSFITLVGLAISIFYIYAASKIKKEQQQ